MKNKPHSSKPKKYFLNKKKSAAARTNQIKDCVRVFKKNKKKINNIPVAMMVHVHDASVANTTVVDALWLAGVAIGAPS